MQNSDARYRRAAFRSGVTAFLAVLTIVCLTSLPGCNSSTENSNQNRTANRIEFLRRGIGGEPASLDPSQAVDEFSFEVIRDLYEGLVSESAAGDILPGVASSWTIDATGTVYTFNLRHDAKWSNGKNVRAQDFVAAWQNVVDPKRASPVADLLRPIAHASAIIAGQLPATQLDAHAVRDDLLVVQLEQPAPYFAQLLTHTATFPIYSEDAASSHVRQTWVSNGPYVLSSWIPGAKLQLTANQFYWAHNDVRIKLIEYYPITDENSEFNRYRAGQLDLTQNVPASSLPFIETHTPNELIVAPFLGTAYYAINLRSRSGSNPMLRQALAMSIDRSKLQATMLLFGQTPAYGFVPPGTWNYDPQSWEWKSLPDSNRLREAQRLYELAGYSQYNPLHLRVLFNSNGSIKRMAIAIASMWKQALGIDTELIEEEFRVFLDSRKDTQRWDIARLGWTADYNDAGNFLNIFRSSTPNNDSGYSNQYFDDLLDRAATTPDASGRRIILQQAEKLLLSEYPVIPIYFYSSKRLIKPYVIGARPNPLNRLYSKHLSIDIRH